MIVVKVTLELLNWHANLHAAGTAYGLSFKLFEGHINTEFTMKEYFDGNKKCEMIFQKDLFQTHANN